MLFANVNISLPRIRQMQFGRGPYETPRRKHHHMQKQAQTSISGLSPWASC